MQSKPILQTIPCLTIQWIWATSYPKNNIILLLGVPGFTAAMVRHLHSLRRMQRDHGWIHTLLEEAENERMHLMTFLQLKNPGPIFRFGVVCTQYVFTAGFFLAYLASPKFCHRYVKFVFNININFLNFTFYQLLQLTSNLILRFVGYLEEEAVKTPI